MNTLNKYKLCRLCLCGGEGLVDIFEENGERDFMIEDTIEDLLRFQVVREVGIPWLACRSCLDKLSSFRLFKQRSIECKDAFEARVSVGRGETLEEEYEQSSNEICVKEELEDEDRILEASKPAECTEGNSEMLEVDLIQEECDEGETSGGVNLTNTEIVIDMDSDVTWMMPNNTAETLHLDPIHEECDEGETSGVNLTNTEIVIDMDSDVTWMRPNNTVKKLHLVRESNTGGDAVKLRRRRSKITLEKKMFMIKKYEQGQGLCSIARELGHPVSTVSSILKDSDRIKSHVNSAASLQSIIMTKRRFGAIYEMEKLLKSWIEIQIQRKVPLSLKKIQAMAKKLHEEIKGKCGDPKESFVASDGWFVRFKNRAGYT